MQTASMEQAGGRAIRPTSGGAARVTSTSAQPASLSAAVLMTDVEAAQCMGISRRKFHELRDQPWMPRPIVLGPRIVRWARSELEHAVAAMPRQEHASEPAQLRRGRIDSMKRGSAA